MLAKKRPDNLSQFDLSDLAKQTKFFTGADIQQIIIDAMYKAFSENREFNQDDLIQEINTFKLN